MIWILATRGASTKLQSSPFTETSIAGVHSVVYRLGVDVVPISGGEEIPGNLGTFLRGAHHASGFVFSYHGSAAEELLMIDDAIDLIVRYRANGGLRKRTFADVVFAGDATVTVPPVNNGLSPLIGVPFRVQISVDGTLEDHIVDEADA